MTTMREERQRLGLTQMELSQITRINQAHLSQIETAKRSPTPSQKQRIRAALGAISFYEKEDLGMSMNVPAVPTMRWKPDGTPDFSHLEGDGGSVRDQLETLIVEGNGDGASLKHLTTEQCYFEVLEEDGERTIYKQSYFVGNGKALLRGDAVEAGEEFETLSRRRVPKLGVPSMPTRESEGDS